MATMTRSARTDRQDRVETAPEAEASQRRRPARRRASATEHSDLGERLIAGVPARIMRPRLVFLSCLGAIIAFGLLMVYSASSVEALSETGSSTYYLMRQAIFVAIGLVAFAFICSRRLLPWELFRSRAVWWLWAAVLALLVIVLAVGSGGEDWGATRWISLGFFNLQPSELAKPAIVLVAGKVMAEYYEDCSTDTPTFLFTLLGAVLVPLALIILQPDLGTSVIIVVAVVGMGYLAGFSYRLLGLIALAGIVAIAALIAAAPYRLTRFLASLDPWSDPYDTGYQATLAIMAFASGGLFGRGIGNSTMKYNYLPEAHNDYILSIIGEELGFVGTLAFIAVFLVMLWAALTIARRSPTLHGQLVAGGCTFILGVQFFVNVLGVLGVIPMTGKPLPFVSYGGSSILVAMILAAIICRVSLESNVETVHDARRAGLSVMGAGRAGRGQAESEQDAVSSHLGRSTAGSVRVRRGAAADEGWDADASAGTGARSRRAGFSVYEGGRGSAAASDSGRAGSGTGTRPRSRRGYGGGYGDSGDYGDYGDDRPRGGYERINLSGGEPDRLRTDGVRPGRGAAGYDDVDEYGYGDADGYGGGRGARSGGTRSRGRRDSSSGSGSAGSRYGRSRYER